MFLNKTKISLSLQDCAILTTARQHSDYKLMNKVQMVSKTVTQKISRAEAQLKQKTE